MARTINVGNVIGPQGPAGQDGLDAKINGRNTINIVAGNNVDFEQEDDTLTINSTDTIYDDTQIKADINNLKTNKADKTEIPDVSNFITKSVDDLVNYYLKSETYTQTEVNNLIGAINQFHYEIVEELPTTGANNILYLVPRTTTETNNIYDEYVYANNNWEKIGSTDIDLSGYVTMTQLNAMLANYTTTTDLTALLATKANSSDIPTKTSDLTNDSGFIDEEVDPMFMNSPASGITNSDISNWNGKEDSSNKTTTISSSSTNTQYPSALAVYNLFNSIVDGDEVAY